LTGRFQPLVPKTSASEGNPCGRLEEVALWEMSSWFAATLRRQLRAMFRWRGVTLPQVFFDVDDTVTCSGGAIGGVHEAGYWGEVYPGAAQFILELGRGSRRWMRGVCPPLPRLLSSRPEHIGALHLEESSTLAQEFRKVGDENGFVEWGVDLEGSLYGRFRDLFGMVRGNYSSMGRTKADRWRLALESSRGRQDAIFVGDDGQGDVVAALEMARGPSFRAAFIHQVAPVWHDAADRSRQLERQQIFLFRGYLEAAGIAARRGLISSSGHRRVSRTIRSSSLARLCRLHAKD